MATRLKTVQFAAPVLTTLTNNTLTNIPQFTVYLPETGTKTIKKAWVDITMDDIITATGGTITTQTVNLRLDSNSYTSTTNGNSMTNSGENASIGIIRDFTTHFTTNWTGTSMTCDIQVQVNQSTGTTLGMVNVCAILYITYEYDDTSTTQIKTVLIPLNAPSGSLPTTKTSYDTIPALDTYLPEASKTYRNIYICYEGNTNSNSTTDFTVSFELSSLGVQTTESYEMELLTDRFVRYIYDITSVITTNTTHTFNMWSSLADTMDSPLAYLCVTYEYNESTSTSIMNSLQIPMSFISPTPKTSDDYKRSKVDFYIQEANPSLQKLSFQLFIASNEAVDEIGLRIGTGTFSVHSISGTGVTAGMRTGMVRNDSPSGITIGRGKNTLTADIYNTSTSNHNGFIGGFWIINYTSDKHTNGSGVHNHTVIYPLYTHGTTSNVQYLTTTADAPTFPETNYFISSLGFYDMKVARQDQKGYTLMTERLVSEGGLGYELIHADATGLDQEMGVTQHWMHDTRVFTRWPNDEDSNRLPISTSRRFFAYTAQGSNRWNILAMYINYHSITYTVSGNITDSNGGTVTLGLHRTSDSEKLLETTRTGNGSYSFTWYDNTENVYVDAYETNSFKGRSGNGTAS